jgi:hypothetical protein
VTRQSTRADRLARAILEEGPASGAHLAVAVGARKATVLCELRLATARFERVGRGRASLWRLAGTGSEPLHGHGSPVADHGEVGAVLERLAALERRLAVVEQRLDLMPSDLATSAAVGANGRET